MGGRDVEGTFMGGKKVERRDMVLRECDKAGDDEVEEGWRKRKLRS